MNRVAWRSVLVSMALLTTWLLAPAALAASAPAVAQSGGGPGPVCIRGGQPVTCPSGGLPSQSVGPATANGQSATMCGQGGQPVTCPSGGLPSQSVGPATANGQPATMCGQGGQAVACPSFSDVPQGYWAFPAIMALTRRGVVGGFPNGTFQPDASVTWGQFAKMLVVALGSPASGTAPAAPGVDQSAWYAPFVNRLEAMLPPQIDAQVQPDASMNREAVAAVVGTVRGGAAASAAQLPFSDAASIDSWALPGVERAYAAGFIHGFPDGSFRPQADVTRAQAAEIVAAALGMQTAVTAVRPGASGPGSSGG